MEFKAKYRSLETISGIVMLLWRPGDLLLSSKIFCCYFWQIISVVEYPSNLRNIAVYNTTQLP